MGIFPRLTTAAAVVAAVAILACEHTTPFSNADYSSTTPLYPGDPARLTYNAGVDARPSWLPNGSAFLYTQEQLGRPDDDRCLAEMPSTGGSVVQTICDQSDPGNDSLNDLESPSVSTDGRIVYARTAMIAGIGHVGPDHAQLLIAPWGNPLAATVLQSIPYFGPANRSVDMVSDVHWVGPSTIVFLTERWTYPPACGRCLNVDTVRTGLDIQRIDIGATPVLSLVSGTDQATSVTAAGPDSIYYTIAGDVGVHLRVLSTNADTVIFTFAAPPTDVTANRNRLVVVVGTDLHFVNLQAASDVTIPASFGLPHRPALSPDGRSLVVEVAPTDTTGAVFPGDLWLWRLP